MQKSSICSCIWPILGEALWCYACSKRGCLGRREECGSLLRDPVCATIDAPRFYMKGCMSEYICREQEENPGVTASCCRSYLCNR
ncbi:hypothetical protein QTP86_021553 [Hemibagrus guttatus]|nr:hypothetical protein QTP86_021553 [Hemibagrus guttatus]